MAPSCCLNSFRKSNPDLFVTYRVVNLNSDGFTLELKGDFQAIWSGFLSCHFSLLRGQCISFIGPADANMNELVEDDKNLTVNGVQFSFGMTSLLKEGGTKKQHQPLSSVKPPSVPTGATVAFPIEWVLVRDANVFMGDVAL